VSAQLLTDLQYFRVDPDNDLLSVINMSGTLFTGTIASVNDIGDFITYNVISGNDDAIKAAATGQIARIRIRNVTRGDGFMIADLDTALNKMWIQGDIPAAWDVGDTITAQSALNDDVFNGRHFFDCEVYDNSVIPDSAVILNVAIHNIAESSTGQGILFLHPNVNPDPGVVAMRQRFVTLATPSQLSLPTTPLALINRRFQFYVSSVGTGTFSFTLRLRGYWAKAPK
jgi:hypothetical protein